MFRGDYETANNLVKKMQGLYSESYMPLGDLVIKQNFAGAQPSDYYRDLNIQDAVSVTRFTINGTEYKREIFSSAPDHIIVVRLSANKPKQLNIEVTAKSILRYRTDVVSSNEIILKGKAPAHVDPSYFNDNKEPVIYGDAEACRGMRFALLIKATSKDGKIKTETSGIQISNASEIILFLSAATSFNGFDKCPDKDGKDEIAIAKGYLSKAIAETISAIIVCTSRRFS